MSELVSPIFIQFVGLLIVAVVLAQVLLLVIHSVRRLEHEKARHDISLDLLRARVQTTMVKAGMAKDRSELSWNGFRKFKIQKKIPEAPGVHSFYLVPHDGKKLPPFEPGQYLTFQLKLPNEPKPVIRCYSLSDTPIDPDHYRVSIKKVPPPRDKPELPPGRSSTFFNEILKEGDILDVKAPSGHFFMDMNKATPVVLIGGGIGITPVMSMLNSIVESGVKREAYFFLGLRDRSEHMMKEYLERLERENENIHLHICYSKPTDDDVEGTDYQHAERVSVDLFKRVLPSSNFDYYMCGPPPMMSSVTTDLKEWGVPDAHVNFEAFGPASVKPKKKVEDKPADANAPAINIEFSISGKTLKWDGSSDSILDFAEDNGITMESGCRAGNCGTCITAVKSGDISYSIEPGSAPEEGSCLTCICVPKQDLVLDA
jgi:ferredoxin-NADP reductase